MKIVINGTATEITGPSVAEALAEAGFGARVATALNGDFLPAAARAAAMLRDGDRLEVVAPMQGG